MKGPEPIPPKPDPAISRLQTWSGRGRSRSGWRSPFLPPPTGSGQSADQRAGKPAQPARSRIGWTSERRLATRPVGKPIVGPQPAVVGSDQELAGLETGHQRQATAGSFRRTQAPLATSRELAGIEKSTAGDRDRLSSELAQAEQRIAEAGRQLNGRSGTGAC